jgi:transcriptional regulator with XRE-family HTH domain
VCQPLGKNFARLRGDLSQKEVAELMRQRGFRWSQATVWSIEKGERPLRLSEAEAVLDALGQPFFNLTADEGEAVVDRWMRECSAASESLKAAIERFERGRLNLALSYRRVEERDRDGTLTNRYHDAGGWLQTTVDDLVREYRERDMGEDDFRGQLSSSDDKSDRWMDMYNDTIAREYPDGEPEAED